MLCSIQLWYTAVRRQPEETEKGYEGITKKTVCTNTSYARLCNTRTYDVRRDTETAGDAARLPVSALSTPFDWMLPAAVLDSPTTLFRNSPAERTMRYADKT